VNNLSPNTHVAAGDLQPGDVILYGPLAVEVAGVTASSWLESGERV
jgi:hypothetical protein